MFDRILVALDGSKLAEQALPYAREMGNAFASKIFLVKVCQTTETDLLSISQAYLDKQAEQLKTKLAGKVQVNTSVLTGRPAPEIVKYASKNDISLIIVTSRGISGVIPWLLGSTTNELIHSVKVPLLVVKITKAPLVPKLKRLLVPLDGSETSEAILPYAVELAKNLPAEIILIRIITPGMHVHTIGGVDYVYFKDKDMQSMIAEAQEYLSKTSSKLSTSVVIKREVKIGDPSSEIIKYASENDCDLIAVSSHGHSYVESWTYGSVTYKILHSSDRPILILPRKTTFT